MLPEISSFGLSSVLSSLGDIGLPVLSLNVTGLPLISRIEGGELPSDEFTGLLFPCSDGAWVLRLVCTGLLDPSPEKGGVVVPPAGIAAGLPEPAIDEGASDSMCSDTGLSLLPSTGIEVLNPAAEGYRDSELTDGVKLGEYSGMGIEAGPLDMCGLNDGVVDVAPTDEVGATLLSLYSPSLEIGELEGWSSGASVFCSDCTGPLDDRIGCKDGVDGLSVGLGDNRFVGRPFGW